MSSHSWDTSQPRVSGVLAIAIIVSGSLRTTYRGLTGRNLVNRRLELREIPYRRSMVRGGDDISHSPCQLAGRRNVGPPTPVHSFFLNGYTRQHTRGMLELCWSFAPPAAIYSRALDRLWNTSAQMRHSHVSTSHRSCCWHPDSARRILSGLAKLTTSTILVVMARGGASTGY
jgi:hypothetical protein